MKVNERIKYYRKKLSITQSELAQKTGISLRALSNYETGLRKPPLEVLLKIADVLDISVVDLDPERLAYGEGVLFPSIENWDKTIDTKKLAKEVKILDSLSQASTEQLIEELNNRSDFPIEIKIK